MKIVIINGNPSIKDTAFDGYVTGLSSLLTAKGHSVQMFTIRDMSISPCIGCFNCWVKTPGVCVFRDDAVDIARVYINSDFAIMASPLIMGYISAIGKSALDRMIPLIHPHLEEVDGEAHHLKRYPSYPGFGLLLGKEPSTDEEDISIVTDIFKRAAINLRSELAFIRYTDSPVQETADAVNVY